MRIGLLVLGIVLVLLGLLWVGQGTGYFPYPSYSFMISQMSWAYRGIAVAVIGVVMILISRRIGR